MYLNLDLLYNVNKYLYPLFYYGDKYGKREVYCPITKKSINIHINDIIHTFYYDFITKNSKYNNRKISFTEYCKTRIFTENTLNRNGYIYNKCNPVKLTKKELHFLKSNTRIKL